MHGTMDLQIDVRYIHLLSQSANPLYHACSFSPLSPKETNNNSLYYMVYVDEIHSLPGSYKKISFFIDLIGYMNITYYHQLFHVSLP